MICAARFLLKFLLLWGVMTMSMVSAWTLKGQSMTMLDTPRIKLKPTPSGKNSDATTLTKPALVYPVDNVPMGEARLAGLKKGVRSVFPDALTDDQFISEISNTLAQLGFTKTNSLPCVGLCRDESTRLLQNKIYDAFGEPFVFASLAGMVFFGNTGFGAMKGHAPIYEDKERIVIFLMPHIAVNQAGEVGKMYREGRRPVNSACGALLAYQGALNGNKLGLDKIKTEGEEAGKIGSDSIAKVIPLNDDDLELSLICRRLSNHLLEKRKNGDAPDGDLDLVAVTRLTQSAMLEDMEKIVESCVDFNACDVAIVSGVQIHAQYQETDQAVPVAFQQEFVSAGPIYTIVNGEVTEIAINAETDRMEIKA